MSRWILIVSILFGSDVALDHSLCSRGSLYLGNARSSGLFVDETTGQAVFTRSVVDGEGLLDAMRRSRQQRNLTSCATSAIEACITITLEQGVIILAFREGNQGDSFDVQKARFRIREKAKDFGFGLGDMYWIEYTTADKNNPAGLFTYSTSKGVLGISLTDDTTGQKSPLGSTLTLVSGTGLLSQTCKH